MTLQQLMEMGLSEEIAKKVLDAHQTAIKDQFIPKMRFDEVNEEKKQYKTQVDELNQQLGGLQKQLKDNEGATSTIEQLKQQIADKETELATTRKTNAIKLQVLQAGPNDVADIMPHIKADVVTIADDGKVTGLDEQLKALKESKPYLFSTTDPDGTGGSLGNGKKDKTTPADNGIGKRLAEQVAAQAGAAEKSQNLYFK